jgi:hypothetical protein
MKSAVIDLRPMTFETLALDNPLIFLGHVTLHAEESPPRKVSPQKGPYMTIKRRIFISSPRDEYLDDRRNKLKWAIVNEIERSDPPFEAQVFGSPEGGRGLAAIGSWSAENAASVMHRCVGNAVLGFPIWKCSSVQQGQTISLVTEYCHYEGALAKNVWTSNTCRA